MSWSPEQKEELVRLVGENIRQNIYSNYQRGLKTINWVRIADKMNQSNECQRSSKQIKSKWDYMVDHLPETSFGEKKEQTEINRYTVI